MGRRLKTFVHIDGVAYGPDDRVPSAVAARIGDHAWEDDEWRGEEGPEGVGFKDPTTQQPPVEAPPRSGRGSGVEAWREFAAQHELDVDADASREDIIAAAETAELIEREEG
ncbi:hypothetical protein ACLQ2N_08220 [Streptomyces sp. DT224]|uniref:hypothetical protein n=1 Tax=Streptomyces sp. DT224 TaxID=3393426 RepID=UPI003CF06913